MQHTRPFGCQPLVNCMQGICVAACVILSGVMCVPTAGKKPLLDTLGELHVSSLSDELNAQPDAPDASLHELHSKVDPHKPKLPNTKADDEQPASHQAAAAPPPAMSATAVAALTQLLNACLTQQAMPTLQDIMKDRQEKLESSGAAEHALPVSYLGGVVWQTSCAKPNTNRPRDSNHTCRTWVLQFNFLMHLLLQSASGLGTIHSFLEAKYLDHILSVTHS